MTADAKIGLLLGLVFIFVIAFIINGLPSFGDRTQAADGATMQEFEDDRIGVADNAQEPIGWEEILQDDAVDTPELAVDEPDLPTDELEPVIPEPETAVAAETSDDARSVYELPSIDSLVDGVSRGLGGVVNRLAERGGTVTEMASQSPPATFDPEPVPTESLDDAIDVALEESHQTPEPQRQPEPASARSRDAVEVRDLIKKISPKTYVVQKGDVLATVAKKAYGEEEGNRLVNINRIFEANRNVLDSPDKIVEGQKLVIPPLPAGQKNDALTHELLEKVEAVGRRNLPETPKASGRVYTVRQDDSFWKIAAEQLGSGTRWKEIVELNGLKEDATLQIGSELKLPKK